MIGLGAVWTPGPAERIRPVLDRWKGVRYETNGRSRQGVDCVGFAAAVMAEMGGVAYEHPAGTNALNQAVLRDAMRALHLAFVEGWACRPGDLLVLRHYDTHQNHVAVAGYEPWTLWSAINDLGVVPAPFSSLAGVVRCQHILRQEAA